MNKCISLPCLSSIHCLSSLSCLGTDCSRQFDTGLNSNCTANLDLRTTSQIDAAFQGQNFQSTIQFEFRPTSNCQEQRHRLPSKKEKISNALKTSKGTKHIRLGILRLGIVGTNDTQIVSTIPMLTTDRVCGATHKTIVAKAIFSKFSGNKYVACFRRKLIREILSFFRSG